MTKNMYIPSLYTHLFKRNEKFYLYNAQSGFFCEITEQTYEILYNKDYDLLSADTLNLFISKKVLLNKEEKYLYYNECRSRFLRETNESTILNLVIAPTIRCNFNCPYCFELKTDQRIMSDEVESQLLDFIKGYKQVKTINLTWYGGEPLLAIKRITSLWKRLTTELPHIKIQEHIIVTNGWLINDNTINFFKESHLNSIQITLDGIADHHNKTRCLKDGTPTFERIIGNIKRLTEELPSLDIAVRVNVNRKNPADLSSIAALFKENGCNKVYVYPGFIREDASDSCSLTYNSYSGETLHEFFKQASTEGFKTNFLPSPCNSRGCMMQTMNALIVGPGGEIYKCWNDVGHEERIVGYIHGDHPVDKVRLYRYLNDTSAFTDPKCKDCNVFPLCDGGCGHYRYRNNFEKGEFNSCTRYKNNSVLEESLLLSASQKAQNA
jgi:uncharacterized protein